MLKRKYNNIKKVINGIEFDSIKEACRYQWLLIMQKDNLIKNLKTQPEFILQESFKRDGKTHRSIKYIADFQYADMKTGKLVVEDTKGFKTEVYKIKKKLLLFKFPGIDFREL